MHIDRVVASLGRFAARMALVALVGCGQIPHLEGATASGSRTQATPTISATMPPASRPTPTQAASVFGTCRLPVIFPHPPGDTRAGWLDVPAGTYSPDPSSNLAGATVLAWDAGVGKWVPTEPKNISPDGMTYVAENVPSIEIVNARTGAITLNVPFPNGSSLYVIGYTPSTIYFASGGKNPAPGVWKLDTTSGSLTQVSKADGIWDLADDAAVWGTGFGSVTVRRLDLATGVVTDVHRFGDPGYVEVGIAGLAGSGVLVISSNAGYGGTELSSVVVVHPDGSVAAVDVPLALQHAALAWGSFQDGPTVLFKAYYPLDWPEPPAGLHAWGLAAFDPDHGLQLLMKNTPPDMYFLGRCISP